MSLDLDAVRSGLNGRLVLPGDTDYDRMRTVMYGGHGDKRPAATVVARSVRDVVHAVNFARDNGLELAVRSGGHSNAGHSVTNGGLVVDLREMNAMSIEPAEHVATAEPGVTAVQFSAKAAEFGLAVGFGDAGSVGLGGIATGGGVGYLSRLHGLTVDAILEADVVTADGNVLTASAVENPDLFWGVRGGGGNFGVVTRFKFRLFDLPHFTGGMLMLPATVETITGFVAAAEAAPEALGTIANIMPAPPMPFLPAELVGQVVLMGMMAYAGSPDGARAAIAPFRSLATPIADFVRDAPYPSMYPPEDPDYHPTAASKNVFADAIGADDAAAILDALAKSNASLRAAQIRVMGGAVDRVPADATAYAHRDGKIMVNVAAFYDGEDDRDEKWAWVNALATRLAGDNHGAYVNFIGDEGADRVRDAYPGDTWDRLRAIKAKYDPHNLFRLNQNIPPA